MKMVNNMKGTKSMNNMKQTTTLSIIAGIVLFAALPMFQGCVVSDRRTVGTVIDDQSTEVKAMHSLAQDKALWRACHVNFLCYNNVLLMVGQTFSEDYKRQAEEAVSDLPKIRRVHNELTVEPPLSVADRSKDTWITTQIKAKMVGNKNIDATKIKVITENRVVYLMGLATPKEEAIATDIARAVKGVDKVVQIFEQAE